MHAQLPSFGEMAQDDNGPETGPVQPIVSETSAEFIEGAHPAIGRDMTGNAAHDLSGRRSEAAVNLDVLCNHFLARKSLRVADAFFAPESALIGMA